MRVSPFRHPRIHGYLLLPAAFRSLSRLSSALSAKASTLRSYSLNLSSVLLFSFIGNSLFVPGELSFRSLELSFRSLNSSSCSSPSSRA